MPLEFQAYTLVQKSHYFPSERGAYEHFNDEETEGANRSFAADHGVAAAVRHFQRLFPTRKVKESSVRTWRDKYLEDLQIRKKEKWS